MERINTQVNYDRLLAAAYNSRPRLVACSWPHGPYSTLQCESKKFPPEDLWRFFQNGWEFFNQILCAYYAFLSTLDYKFSFNYLQV